MDKKDIVKKLVNQELEDSSKEELIELLLRKSIAIDVDKNQNNKMSFKDKMADKISNSLGSWMFIIIFLMFLIFWIALNTILKAKLDPYPFILLNLVLSCFAAIQAPIIMMSQNREAKKDSMRNENDYIIDLKSELILEDLHHKLETILKNQALLLKLYENITKEDN